MLSFIETPLFTRLVYDYLSDEEYAALQAHLAHRSSTLPGRLERVRGLEAPMNQ